MNSDYSSRDIGADIASAMEKHTTRNAFVINDIPYTYQFLSNMVYDFVHDLQKEHARIIAIIAEDRIEVYAAILAVLATGKTYVILHPAFPDNRNKTIAEQAKIELIIGNKTIWTTASWCRGFTCWDISSKLSENYTPITFQFSSKNPAYIIFTSGSTGLPKGVPISRDNLNAFYNAYRDLGWSLDYHDRMLQMFELTFDVSVVSFLYPLTLGACIYTVGYKDVKYLKVFDIMDRYELTFAAIPPSLLQLCSPYFNEINLPQLKYLVVTAEASPVDLLIKFRLCAPQAVFMNLYGPTESTIYCTAYRIPVQGAVKQHNGMIAIGKPFKNMEFKIIGNKDIPVGEYQEGELWISGPQVMSGYWNNQEKNKIAMVKDTDGKIFYKTGDICYSDSNGDLIYCGRKDSQVKIQGFRVELSEIENTTRQFFTKSCNVVALVMSVKEIQELHLVIEHEQCDLTELKIHLKKKLPSYMIPKQIFCIPCFPLNTNNKIDRKAIIKMIENKNKENGNK